MLKKLSLFAIMMTAAVGTLAANTGDARWRVTGEYLYYMPTVDDTSYVIKSPVSTTFPNGKRHNNDFDFHSGWRVGVGHTFCDCNGELALAYTQLEYNQSNHITDDFLWATVGRADFANAFENFSGTASSKLDLRYQRIDALYSQPVFNDCNCGFNFAVQFGIEAAQLRLKERNTYVSGQGSVATVGLFEQYSKADGIGPQIGFAFDYELYRGCGALPGVLTFNVVSSGSLLAAETRVHSFESLNEIIDLDVKNSKTWRVIPAIHARVGLNYDLQIACTDASIGFGYDFSSYLRGLTRVGYPDDVADSLSYNNYYNFDVQGLYVSVTGRF